MRICHLRIFNVFQFYWLVLSLYLIICYNHNVIISSMAIATTKAQIKETKKHTGGPRARILYSNIILIFKY